MIEQRERDDGRKVAMGQTSGVRPVFDSARSKAAADEEERVRRDHGGRTHHGCIRCNLRGCLGSGHEARMLLMMCEPRMHDSLERLPLSLAGMVW